MYIFIYVYIYMYIYIMVVATKKWVARDPQTWYVFEPPKIWGSHVLSPILCQPKSCQPKKNQTWE